ncbi:hypothetical protein SAMN02927921_00146 [Sinomicrobium oceani]|uniref:Lipocalin-like domain-containing protein n=1 Tax=Sinomicrobium oceani TaxID=1150368 RepID=A0A1K1LPF8_9FLAO|nr:hypothetical protein [Sinomicrobium oceani]SFW12762.1 hypothetical protein SAMN02927921_00146 [Sinomicrobium oceani]
MKIVKSYSTQITRFCTLIVVLWGCTPSPDSQLKDLNGYWEIEKVEFPDGTVKEYGINTTIDYIETTTDSSGIRKKMQPRLDGGYNTSGDQENFGILIKEGHLFLEYHTPLSSWEEKVIKVTEERLILRNTDNLNYFYKRFEPMNLDLKND